MALAEQRSVTPFLWFFIGLGLGIGSVEILALPVLVITVTTLAVRAARSRHTRHWADLAALILGAGLVIAFFAVPLALTPLCSSTGGSGGCDPNGHCWSNGTTTCVSGHLFFIIAAAVASVLVLSAAVIAVRLVRRAATAR